MTKVKGGRLARKAGMVCQEPLFGLYLDQRRRQANAMEYRQLPDGTHAPEDCADWLRWACGVKSRAAIDHCDRAKAMLLKVLNDYEKWKEIRRVMP